MQHVEECMRFRKSIETLMKDLGFIDINMVNCCCITLTQCQALVEIGRMETISLKELAVLLQLDNSTMSRTVDNLVHCGFVKREENARDRRYISLRLSEEGRLLYKRLEKQVDHFYEEILAHIPADKKDQVLESLELIISLINSDTYCG